MGLGRALGLIGTVLTLAIGMYIYSLQVRNLQPSANGAGASDEAALITGVKLDLIGIANAERSYMAAQGKYASMDELTSGGYLIPHERPPYVYDVSITPSGFSSNATRTTKGSPAEMWVTESMEVQSSE